MARPTTRHPSESPARDTARTASDAPTRSPGDPPLSEDILIRNYDLERSYTLHVSAEGRASGTEFEWTYYLDPGEFRSELGVLEPGVYDVTVETAACGEVTKTCEIGPDAGHTALVETGNLTVAVSQAPY